MRKLIIAFLLGGILVLWIQGRDASFEKTEAGVREANSSTAEFFEEISSQKSQKSPEDDEFDALIAEIFNPDGTLKKLPRGIKAWRFYGTIRQHLSDGHLLIHGAGRGRDAFPMTDFAIVTLPGFEKLPDGAGVEFLCVAHGTYQYTTVMGALRTIPKLLHVPPEALPTPAPGEWMWENSRRESGLRRP